MNILIPDGLGHNILAAIRSLGRKGHKITLAHPRPREGARGASVFPILGRIYRSRYCSKVVFIASPFDGADNFLSDVLQLMETEKYDLVLPFSHACVACACYGKDRIEEFAKLPFGDFHKFMIFHDKYETVQLAKKLGVPVPETYLPQDLNEVEAIAPKLVYPVVVKARIGCGVKNGVRYAKNKDELVNGYKEVTANENFGFLDNYDRPLIQEYIPGKIHDVATVSDRGKVKGALTQVREITYPIYGGTGSVNVTTYEPELLDLGRRMLESVGWHGPAQVEFKLDPRDSSYKLMEVNPKFWGTLDLSIKAGIDFAEMACQIALSEDVKPQFNYKVGLTYRWLMTGELRSMAQDPHKSKAILEFVRRFFRRNTAYDSMFTDLVPDVVRLLDSVAFIAKGHIQPAGENLDPLSLSSARPDCK